MRKVLLVDAVHLPKVGHVVQEDVALDDARDVAAGRRQDGLDVLAALGRLVGDAAFGEVAVLVGGDLAGDVDGWAGDDGLGLEGGLVVVYVEDGCFAAIGQWARMPMEQGEGVVHRAQQLGEVLAKTRESIGCEVIRGQASAVKTFLISVISALVDV